MMEKNCHTCDFKFTAETEECFFCPQCGAATTVTSSLLHFKTTADYDPYSKFYKPWREASKLPKRPYHNQVNNDPAKPIIPWYPTMRHATRLCRRTATIRKKITEEKAVVSEISAAIENVETIKQPINSEFLEERINHLEDNDKSSPPESRTLKESMLPIAVYEAVWIHCISAVVHMTLIEQVAARSMKAYWIRIGAATYRRDQSMGNAADGVDSVDSVAAGESFQVLATLSNEVGRLIIDQPDDWVDLPAIDATEYFMARHMQRVMLSLARRVVEKSARPLPGEATDLSQQYEVYLREREISAYQQSLADAFQFDEEDSERQEDANAQRKRPQPLPQIVVSPLGEQCPIHLLPEHPGPLYYDDTIAQFSCRLRFNRHATQTYCITQVRVSVSYGNRLDSSALSAPSLALWASAQQATSINLHMQPMYLHFGEQELAPTAVIRFGVDSAAVLAGKKVAGGGYTLSLDEELAAARRSEVVRVAKKLASCVRLQCCSLLRGEQEGQLRFCWTVVGAFSEPAQTSYPWPVAKSSWREEDYSVAEEEEEEEE